MLAQTHVVVERNAPRQACRSGSTSLSADKHHRTRRRHEIRGVDPVSFFFFIDDRPDVSRHIVVRRSFAEQPAQVVIFFAEKAGSQLSISREADARAVAAEGLRHGSDQAYLAGSAVGEAVFARRLAALVGDLNERPPRMD